MERYVNGKFYIYIRVNSKEHGCHLAPLYTRVILYRDIHTAIQGAINQLLYLNTNNAAASLT